MSTKTKKQVWTEPGPIDPETHAATEARKGTAAANPVLSLAPKPPTPARRPGTSSVRMGTAMHGGDAAAEPDHRSPAEIEADITQTRNRLADTLDELTERLTPRALLRRANAKACGVFVGEDGSVRKGRVAIVAGAATSALGGAVALRRIRPR